jgi:lipopolysaccharide transport system permease protein
MHPQRPQNLTAHINLRLTAVWRYKGFVFAMVAREFKARYLGSLLGSLWTVLNPMAMILIYTVIFSRIMQARLAGVDDTMAYGVFICAGLLPWGLLADLLNRCQVVFIDQRNLLQKASFPRITLPVILLFSTAIHFLIAFGIFAAFMVATGRFPGWAILGFFPLLLIQQGFILGIGIFLGTLNVFFRDVGQLVGIVLQFWFWFTPIVYPITILSERLQMLVSFNPMSRLVDAYQRIVLFGDWPQWSQFGYLALAAAFALILGFFFFIHVSGEMVDEL